MKVLLSGASGLIGHALTYDFMSKGWEVYRLIRTPSDSVYSIFWDPYQQILDTNKLEDFDCVIHLSGENIADKKWTPPQKKKISDSRLITTSFLVGEILKLKKPPKLFISSSAIGIYGDRGDEILYEDSSKGEGFLPDLCYQWEKIALPLQDQGIRVVHPRFGIVLAEEGGALKKMYPIFKAGLGGSLGKGRQWMSWISLKDLLGGVCHVIAHENIHGSVNFVSPIPVINREFTNCLATTLNKRAILPVPALALKLFYGDMAEALLLSSLRVFPQKLIDSSYSFTYSDLSSCLKAILDK